MQLFQIRDGPWERLFNGVFQEHEVEIYFNPESVLMVLVYEKPGKDGKPEGAVVDFYRAYSAVGDVDHFLPNLPKEVLVITRHDKEQTLKFVLLAAQPLYVPWREEEFVRDVDDALTKLRVAGEMVKDVSKAYDLNLLELHKADATVKRVFFSQPLLIPLLSTNAHPNPEEGLAFAVKGEVNLGLTREGLSVLEPLELVARSLVMGGSAGERRHALHLAMEGALLSNVPILVFSTGNEFDGLAEAAKDLQGLKAFKVEAEPIGFPVRHFKPYENVFVDLNLVDTNYLLDSFGVAEQEVKDLVKLVSANAKLRGLEDLMLQVKTFYPTDRIPASKINRAVRMLAVMDSRYQGLFAGQNDIEEISKNWFKAIGRAGLVHLEGLDDRARLLVVHNLLKGLMKTYQARGGRERIKSFVFLPEAKELLARDNQDPFAKEIAQLLATLPDYGVGVAVSVDKEIDLAPVYAGSLEARLEIVSGNDCGVNLKGRKNYRVLLRPGLSACSEK